MLLRLMPVTFRDVKLEQIFRIIFSSEDEPTITVNDLEVAQFLDLLLTYKKRRNTAKDA